MLTQVLIWLIYMTVISVGGSWLMRKWWGPMKANAALKSLFTKNYANVVLQLSAYSGIEELIFRLGIIGGGVWLFGTGATNLLVAVSIFLFAVMHMANTKEQHWRLLVIHLGTGSALTYFYLHNGFLAVWALHFLYNVILVTISRWYYSSYPEKFTAAFEEDLRSPTSI